MANTKINEAAVIDRYITSKHAMFVIPSFVVIGGITMCFLEQIITDKFLIVINPQ